MKTQNINRVAFVVLVGIIFFMFGRLSVISQKINALEEKVFNNREDIDAHRDSFSEDIQELFGKHE